DDLVELTHQIPAFEPSEPSDLDKQIAANVVPLVKDGSTLQIGVGNISNALGYGLVGKKNLGIHTEMLTDSMVYLAKQNVINGSEKAYKPNKIVCSFAMGSQSLLDFCDHNPDIEIHGLGLINNPYEAAKNSKFMSINTCLMVDLKGQVASEGVGHRQISGTGGQVDFVRAVNMCDDATSVIALASTHKGAEGIESTICLTLPAGTPVTTLRSDVHYIATEYGVVSLRNQSFEERARRLISIAHPDHRDQLLADAKQAGLIR
ncbi:MAG: acyl-CoA hydrolase, partial [Moritella sp.]